MLEWPFFLTPVHNLGKAWICKFFDAPNHLANWFWYVYKYLNVARLTLSNSANVSFDAPFLNDGKKK